MQNVRRRLMMSQPEDNRFFIFKEGEGFVNGFTWSYTGSRPSVSKNSIGIGGTRSASVGLKLYAGTIGNQYEAYPILRNYSTIYFECQVIEKKNTGSNVGYWQYIGGNIAEPSNHRIVTSTSRIVYSLPLNFEFHTNNNYLLGLFNAGNVYSETVCYNIWVE